MSMLAIPLDSSVSRLFRSIEVEEGKRDESDHITLAYLGDNVPFDVLLKIIPVVFNITSKEELFLVSAKKITTFPKGDDGYPVIAPVESPKLHEIRSKIIKGLDKAGVEYSKLYPDFNPHVTLAYSQKKPKNIKFNKIQWQINQIALYGGDNHDERLYVLFPLAVKIIEKKADFVYEMVKCWKSRI